MDSCLKGKRNTSVVQEEQFRKQNTSLQAYLWWGSWSTLVLLYLAWIILCRAKYTCCGHCRTSSEPKLFFLVLKGGGESHDSCSLLCAGSSLQRWSWLGGQWGSWFPHLHTVTQSVDSMHVGRVMVKYSKSQGQSMGKMSKESPKRSKRSKVWV